MSLFLHVTILVFEWFGHEKFIWTCVCERILLFQNQEHIDFFKYFEYILPNSIVIWLSYLWNWKSTSALTRLKFTYFFRKLFILFGLNKWKWNFYVFRISSATCSYFGRKNYIVPFGLGIAMQFSSSKTEQNVENTQEIMKFHFHYTNRWSKFFWKSLFKCRSRRLCKWIFS